MRKLIFGLICLLPTAALAYDLPVSEAGAYCGKALNMGSIYLDKAGFGSDKYGCHASSPVTGALVEVTCVPTPNNKTGQPFKMNLIVLDNHPGPGELSIADADKGGAWTIGTCD